jgi:hypothetical protein
MVKEDKTKDYGDAVDSMMSCARFWNLGLRRMGWHRNNDLSAREACQLMILFKVSRDLNINKEDNIIDEQGYARIIELFEERMKSYIALENEAKKSEK